MPEPERSAAHDLVTSPRPAGAVWEFVVPWARAENGAWVTPGTAVRGQDYRCWSPACGAIIRLRGGPQRRPHLYHVPRSDISPDTHGEGALHRAAKDWLVARINAEEAVWFGYRCGRCKGHAQYRLPATITGAQAEAALGAWRLDVGLTDAAGQIVAALEIVVSHAMEPEKVQDLDARQIPWVEIAGSEVIAHPEAPLQVVRVGGGWRHPNFCPTCRGQVAREQAQRAREQARQVRQARKEERLRREHRSAPVSAASSYRHRRGGRWVMLYECPLCRPILEERARQRQAQAAVERAQKKAKQARQRARQEEALRQEHLAGPGPAENPYRHPRDGMWIMVDACPLCRPILEQLRVKQQLRQRIPQNRRASREFWEEFWEQERARRAEAERPKVWAQARQALTDLTQEPEDTIVQWQRHIRQRRCGPDGDPTYWISWHDYCRSHTVPEDTPNEGGG